MKTTYLLYLFLFLTFSLVASEKPDTHTAFLQGLNEAKYYKTQQGNTLRYALFKSPAKKNNQTIFFLQGRGTFLEFYEILIGPLLERGFDVWTFDLTGQGGSSRILRQDQHDVTSTRFMQHIDSFDVYLSDIHAFLSEIVLLQTIGPLILGGYSTGGHLALRYAEDYKHPFEAIFVISPLLALKTSLPNFVYSYLFWTASWVINFEKYVPGASTTCHLN